MGRPRRQLWFLVGSDRGQCVKREGGRENGGNNTATGGDPSVCFSVCVYVCGSNAPEPRCSGVVRGTGAVVHDTGVLSLGLGEGDGDVGAAR